MILGISSVRFTLPLPRILLLLVGLLTGCLARVPLIEGQTGPRRAEPRKGPVAGALNRPLTGLGSPGKCQNGYDQACIFAGTVEPSLGGMRIA